MGAKKKTTANRLAKMSDEERTRYLQQKADVEEEARRRKEQLIATFMKNKIRKEDAFARLNLAKINQHWHQLLRKAKCKEMKETLQHMKEWIERTVNLKNETIRKLMAELEQAEEQYSHNFQSHISHIHNIIESHQKYMDNLQHAYETERTEMLETATIERNDFLKKSEKNRIYLQTIRYGEEVTTEKQLKRNYEKYMKKYDDIISMYRLELENMIKSREGNCTAIWRQIATVLRAYVQQTDNRRMHLAELRRLDAESATEIVRNQERIKLEEEQIQRLNDKFSIMTTKYEQKKVKMSKNIETLTNNFVTARKQLRTEVSHDEKQLKLVTDRSNRTIQYLKIVSDKAKQILTLMEISRKFETEEEKILRWKADIDELDETPTKIDSEKTEQTDKSEAEAKEELKWAESVLEVKTHPIKKNDRLGRPKTSISRRSSASHEKKTEQKFTRQCKQHHQRKISAQDSAILNLQNGFNSNLIRNDVQAKSNSVDENIAALCNLEGFWNVYSKVKVNCEALREEKSELVNENKRLKEIMRNVLEAVALKDSGPILKIMSKRRSVSSAPSQHNCFC